ncbi:MAG: oligosaccharide flippase family protein [Candidatus Aminicenantales bacterium]
MKKQYIEVATIAKGAGIFLTGTIFGSFLRYIFEVLLARRLGPSLFGVFFLGFSVFKLLEKGATLELESGMLRFVALYNGEKKLDRVKGTILAGLKIALLGGTVPALALFIFAAPVSQGIFHEVQLSTVLKILSLGVIFTAGTEVLVHSLQGLGSVRHRVYVRMLFEPALSILLAFLFLNLNLGLVGASLAFLAPVVFGLFLALWFLQKLFPSLTRKEVMAEADVKGLLRFSLPLFLAGLLALFTRQVTPLMLGYFCPAREVGVFAAALRTSLFLTLVLDSFNAIFAPMISDLTNRRELGRLAELFQVVTKWVFALVLPLFLAFFFFGREVLGLWGKGYDEGLTPLVVLCMGQLVNCLTGPGGYMISMSGRTAISLANASGVLVLNLILNLILIPRHGVLGAAVAVSLALSLVNVVRLIEVWLILRIHPYRVDFLKPVGAGIFASFVLAVARPRLLPVEGILVRLGIGTLVLFSFYVAILVLLGISQEEKFVLARIKQKLGGRSSRNEKSHPKIP